MLIRSCRLSSFLSLLTLCLVGLSVVERGVLKSPTKIVNISISPISYISSCFTYLAALLVGIYTFRIAVFYYYVMSLCS